MNVAELTATTLLAVESPCHAEATQEVITTIVSDDMMLEDAIVEAPPVFDSEVPDKSTTQVQVDEAQQSSTLMTVASIPSEEKKNDKKPNGKSRKRKYKPALVTRLKLDANGEMVLDDPTAEDASVKQPIENDCDMIVEDRKETYCPLIPRAAQVNAIYFEPSLEYDCRAESFVQLENIEEIPVDENLNETKVDYEIIPENLPYECQQPSTSTTVRTSEEAFDGEAFLNSLEFEKLVLVEAQRDGKDVYEIHEMDPVTQEIADEPLDLPARYVDLIIKIMMQEQDEDE